MPSTLCRLDLCTLYMKKAHKHIRMESNTEIQSHTQTCSPGSRLRLHSRPWTNGHAASRDVSPAVMGSKKGISIFKSHVMLKAEHTLFWTELHTPIRKYFRHFFTMRTFLDQDSILPSISLEKQNPAPQPYCKHVGFIHHKTTDISHTLKSTACGS